MDLEFNLRDYWGVVKKRKWIVLFVVSVVFIIAIVTTRMQSPVYRAQAMVKYEPPTSRLVASDQNYDPFMALQTQLRILASPEIKNQVAERLHVLPNQLKGSFVADIVQNSNLMTISSSGGDPLAVTNLANAVVDVYADRDIDEHSVQARTTLQDIVKRREEVDQSLKEMEDKRREFLEQHPTSGMSASLAGTLVDMETKKKELLEKYTPSHPEVIQLDRQISAIKSRLEQLPSADIELEGLMRDIRVNEEVYVSLSRQMEDAKIALASVQPYVTIISRATVPLVPVSPNKSRNYRLGAAVGLFLGLLTAFLVDSLDISISTIEDIEITLGVPVLGIIPRFGSENKWKVFKTHLLRRQRYPLDVFRSQLVIHHDPKSQFIELYHSLRANIQSQLPRPHNMVLAFTSTGVAEGKTLTAVNFCLAAAQAGLRTLLIGADIRRPILYRIFGLPKAPGFLEVATGRMLYQDVVRDTVDFLMGEIDLEKMLSFPGIDNFKIMTGWATAGADIVSILSSPEIPQTIQEMRQGFDLIVFDCPPVLLFVDSLLLAPHMDGVVMVYKAGKMARRALKRAKDQLISAKANIVGVVFNDVQASEMEPRYGYYYDYGHYKKKVTEAE